MFLLEWIKSKLNRGGAQGEVLSIMVRLMGDSGNNSLLEILSYFSTMYGEGSVLSVIGSVSREVIETTDPKKKVAEVHRVSLSVTDIARSGYVMKHEKTQVCFRNDFTCVRHIPLPYRGNIDYFLLVEQKEKYAPKLEDSDRCFELLAVSVILKQHDTAMKSAAFVDFNANLPNRECFVRDTVELVRDCVMAEKVCVGLISLFEESASSDADYKGRATSFAEVVMIARKYYSGRVYLVNEGVVAVSSICDVYGMNGILYDIMEHCGDVVGVHMKAVVAYTAEDVRKALYLCESRLCSVSEGDVEVVRDGSDLSGSTQGVRHEKCDAGRASGGAVIDIDVEEVC